MLSSLHIENIAVIKEANLEWRPGFSVLTGETGAGKSIIIDSINLLLGNRVGRDIIRSGESHALVSAVFEELSDGVIRALEEMGFSVSDRSLMLQRTLNADGRSQTRLDGQIITQNLQREIARMLVSIHGQSDSQKLLQKSEHRALLDAYAEPNVQMDAYTACYRALKETEKKLAAVSRDDAEKVRRTEMLKYQIEDIDAAKLRSGEEELLIKERDRLVNYEQISRQVHLAYRALRGGEKGSAYDLLRRAQNALHALDGLIEGADALAERLEAAASEIDDIAETVLSHEGEEIGDPTARIDQLEGRLEEIAKLKRKYGADIDAVLQFRANAAEELETLECSDALRLQLQQELKALTRNASEAARALTQKRQTAAEQIVGEVTQTLGFLDMPKVRFEIRIQPASLGEYGADDIEFMIATNPGEPLQPMIKIASCGELSRIMLALRSVINDRDGAATVIFDEIDTGVSGKTARKIGIKLKESAAGAQVLCVTHSAQIASLADTHYLISKSEKNGRAETRVDVLEEDARIGEIARILGGIEVTDAQREAARDMINEYR